MTKIIKIKKNRSQSKSNKIQSNTQIPLNNGMKDNQIKSMKINHNQIHSFSIQFNSIHISNIFISTVSTKHLKMRNKERSQNKS